MKFEAVLGKFGARRVGASWQAHCPSPLHAHGDRHPSLHISEGQDQRTIIHCFSGCDTASILAAMELSFRDLFPDSGRSQQSTPPIVRSAGRKMADLRARLTLREREILEPVIITTTRENLDYAIARGLALSVEGDLCQIELEDSPCE
jgi:hypothetical protein